MEQQNGNWKAAKETIAEKARKHPGHLLGTEGSEASLS